MMNMFFFTTLLSIPSHFYKLAFKIFDEDASGYIDANEWKNMIMLMRGRSLVGSADKTELQNSKGRAEKAISNAEITKKFFCDGRLLSFVEFSSYMEDLHDTVLRLQFSHLAQRNGEMSLVDFAQYLMSYGTAKQMQAAQPRIEALRSTEQKPVSLNEFVEFHAMIDQLPEIEQALQMFFTFGEPYTASQMIRMVRAVTGISINPAHLEILFNLFDVNGDGKLEESEIVGFLRRKQAHGLTRTRDLGFWKFVTCCQRCYSE